MAKETATYLPAPRAWALRTRVRGTRAASEERGPPSSGWVPRRRRKSRVAERVKTRTREAKAAMAASVPHRRCQMGAWWREIAIGLSRKGRSEDLDLLTLLRLFDPRGYYDLIHWRFLELLLNPAHFLLLGASITSKNFFGDGVFAVGW